MINLLPPQQKKELQNEEKFTVILILEVVFIAFLITLSLLLYLVDISVINELDAEKIILESAEKSVALNENMEQELLQTDNYLSGLLSFYKEKNDFAGVLSKIPASLPDGVVLNGINLSVSAKDKNILQVSIAGFSPDREKIIRLNDNLAREKSFYEIAIPPENLLKPSNINFTASFKAKR